MIYLLVKDTNKYDDQESLVEIDCCDILESFDDYIKANRAMDEYVDKGYRHLKIMRTNLI